MESKYWGTEVAYKNGYAAGARDAKFYVVDAKTGENRGSIIMDEYDEAAQEAHDNLVRGLAEANADIDILTRALKDAVYGLYLALNTYEGPSEDMLDEIAYNGHRIIMDLEAKHRGLS